jgi:hypothetical protein
MHGFLPNAAAQMGGKVFVLRQSIYLLTLAM